MNARVRLVLVTLCIVVTVLILAGATYQGVATALERRRYPHPGRLVDVGGHQLHIRCIGAGTPTVVLEAPAAGMSAAWAWIQPEVARTTRTCSYDRAGLGWSEAGDRQFDPGRVPDELYALLRAAPEPGPYVVAGHSLGASFARVFASRYARHTAGLVLIEPANGDMPTDPRFLRVSPWLAPVGVLRATGLLATTSQGLPAHDAAVVSAFLNRPDHLTRAARELARWDDAVGLASMADLPASVAVVTVNGDESRAILNDETAARRVSAAIARIVERIRAAGG